MLSKKIIFLTGATGTMGEEGLKQILSRSDRFNLRVLVRPSAKNKAFMSRYEHDAALEIVWGDLCCYAQYPFWRHFSQYPCSDQMCVECHN